MTAIILAGGNGRRLKRRSQGVPKVLLPLAGGSVLRHLVSDLLGAGIPGVIVYTSPRHATRVATALEHFTDGHSEPSPVGVVTNDAYRCGPISALISTVLLIETQYILLVLGDVVFERNPFHSFLTIPMSRREVYIGVTPRPQTFAVHYGQIVTARGGYKIADRPARPASGGLQWSGLSLFARSSLLKLTDLQSLRGTGIPLGELVNALAPARGLRIIDCPSFVNINTEADYKEARRLKVLTEHRL